jgi:hypothetical protein
MIKIFVSKLLTKFQVQSGNLFEIIDFVGGFKGRRLDKAKA